MRGLLRLVLAAIAAGAPPAAVQAETLVAARTLRAQTVLGPQDVAVVAGEVPGALRDPAQAVGLESRVALYAGRPIRPGEIGPPALIDRNQIVQLVYASGPLRISAEGRALDRGAAGETVRVMNLSSRTTVAGMIRADGAVVVTR
ncbi:MAG: flagellar basal body P-ring formation chaperone FlgA [Tranquillimonas sp.]|jgi:flagella basal body P-ring formation protein FlgA